MRHFVNVEKSRAPRRQTSAEHYARREQAGYGEVEAACLLSSRSPDSVDSVSWKTVDVHARCAIRTKNSGRFAFVFAIRGSYPEEQAAPLYLLL